MNNKFPLTEKGLTLVELLVTIAIVSMVFVLITTNLIGGIKSFKSVNKQISLHDEANYIMTKFVNEIYVASSVSVDYPKNESDHELNPCKNTIKITKTNSDDVTILGFDNLNSSGNTDAVINNEKINPSTISIACKDDEHPSITVNGSTVSIEMTIQDNETGKHLDLNNKVSFVNVE